MTRSATLWQQLQAQPRALRWAIYGGAVILVLWLYSEIVLPVADAWSLEAAKIEESLHRARAVANNRARDEVVASVGPVEPPAGDGITAEALSRTISSILSQHSVSNHNFSDKSVSKLPGGLLGELASATSQAEYVEGNLEFEATVEEATAIIAELEASPEIEAITLLRMTRLNPTLRTVSVRLTVEAWQISSDTGALRMGGRL